MNTKLLIIIPIVVGIAISLQFVVSSTSGGTHFTQDIDPRFSKATKNGFALSSNMDIYSVSVEDEIQGILIRTGHSTDGFIPMDDGFIHMDDPLPILQKLFPDKNIVSFAVLADGIEIPYVLEDGNMGIGVSSSDLILIVGLSKI